MKLFIRDAVVADVQGISASFHDPAAAERFGPAVLAAFDLLAEHPLIGRVRSFSTPGIRSWVVSGFRNYVVFYRAKGDMVEILAVLDGRRDLDPVMKSRA